jgi:hypothetical protein
MLARHGPLTAAKDQPQPLSSEKVALCLEKVVS